MVKKIVVMLIAGAVALGTSSASFAMMCGSHGSHDAVANTAEGEAVNAGNEICPVSGEKIGQSGMEPATYEYKGKVYNFCCASCIDKFKKDPEKYISKIKK